MLDLLCHVLSQVLVGIFAKGKSVALLEDMPKLSHGNGTEKTYGFDEVAV